MERVPDGFNTDIIMADMKSVEGSLIYMNFIYGVLQLIIGL